MLQILDIGGSSLPRESSQAIKNLAFEGQVGAGGFQLCAVQVNRSPALQLLERELFLLLADLACFFSDAFLERSELLAAAFLIEFDQYLAFADAIAILYEDLLHHPSGGNAEFFHVADGFKLALSHHHFFRTGNGEPADAEGGGADQAPGHRLQPDTILLQNAVVALQRTCSLLKLILRFADQTPNGVVREFAHLSWPPVGGRARSTGHVWPSVRRGCPLRQRPLHASPRSGQLGARWPTGG